MLVPDIYEVRLIKTYISLTLVVDDLRRAGGVLDLERRPMPLDEL